MVAVDAADVICKVVTGGPVSDHKGISLPGVELAVPAVSSKDLDDLRFALKLSVDMVALSFVRHPDDADVVRQVLDQTGSRPGSSPRSRSPRR